ncbi:MAG: VWA domain-containing protein [Taibaiella sp.]|nr:VWA domain-containing protein [Taibaiella sp.]
MDWNHISFAYPLYFALLLVVPFMIWQQLRRKKYDSPALRLTTLSGIATLPPSWRVRLRPILFTLRIISIISLVIALARPQSSNVTESIDSDGIDIVISLDISGSMLAEDFKPNRIEAAKVAALTFVDDRPTDRIGLVIFSGESFTMCPITIDHNVLKEQINEIHSGLLIDGTSIGMGLATSVDRLRNAKGKSRVIILLTDGVNNTGLIDPNTALEIAKAYKVRVYTVGIGTEGQALIPVQTPAGIEKQLMQVQIDEPLLKKIALETGGNYYRATNNRSLTAIYKEIDKLEKTKVEISSFKHYTELFFPFACLALICIALEMLLRYTVYRSITS